MHDWAQDNLAIDQKGLGIPRLFLPTTNLPPWRNFPCQKNYFSR